MTKFLNFFKYFSFSLLHFFSRLFLFNAHLKIFNFEVEKRSSNELGNVFNFQDTNMYPYP